MINTQSTFENKSEEKVKQQNTPKIAEYHGNPEPVINTTKNAVKIKNNYDQEIKNPEKDTNISTTDDNKVKVENNKKGTKGSHETIEEAAKKNTEIKNTHPEDNNKIPNNTKKN